MGNISIISITFTDEYGNTALTGVGAAIGDRIKALITFTSLAGSAATDGYLFDIDSQAFIKKDTFFIFPHPLTIFGTTTYALDSLPGPGPGKAVVDRTSPGDDFTQNQFADSNLGAAYDTLIFKTANPNEWRLEHWFVVQHTFKPPITTPKPNFI